MATLILNDNAMLVAWAESELRESFGPTARAIGQAGCNGDINAVIVFDAITERNANAHIATKGHNWLNRRLLVAMFHYPFSILGLPRLTGMVPSKNTKALSFNSNLGFQYEGLIRESLPNDDLVILGMLARECRFIKSQ